MQLLTIEDLFAFLRTVKYGWVDRNGQKHRGPNDQPGFVLQSPTELIRSRIGICWELTEFARTWFQQHKIPCSTYLIYCCLDDDTCPSHSILVYRDQGRYCWFEPSMHEPEFNYCGIHHYTSLENLLADAVHQIVAFQKCFGIIPSEINPQDFLIYQYSQPKFGIDDGAFYQHCRQGARILLPCRQ